jgi:hypothetical protein
MMESHMGFCHGGLDIVLGSCRVAGINEKRGEGFVEGRGIRNGRQDYSNLSISVSNHSNHSNYSGLLLLERRKVGDHEQSLFPGAFLLFCAFPIYFCFVCTAVRMTGHAGYKVTCPDPVSKWSFLPDHSSSWLVGTGHMCCVRRWQPGLGSILVAQGGWVCGHEEAALRGMLDSLLQPFLRLQHMLPLQDPAYCKGEMEQEGSV